MLFSDTYKEIQSSAQDSLRERGSKFIAFAYPVKSENEVKKYLHDLRSEYSDATHHCYAYILNPDKSAQKSSDDGEPSNSAGKPILRTILSMDLTNTLVIVVRYFGGTMLGIPGLIQAYGDAAKLVLKNAQVIEQYMESHFEILVDFELESHVYALIKKLEIRIISQDYSDKVILKVAVRNSKLNEFKSAMDKNYKVEIKEIKKG
ncbi:MAG: YigZ family protein [Bacteroidetes bacterium]|nr:YigZ family protein [Bacteroidota bacterium]